jgi:phosphate transport system permease protein
MPSWWRRFKRFLGRTPVMLALALIVIPVVIRHHREHAEPGASHSLREAAYALGTPKWKRHHCHGDVERAAQGWRDHRDPAGQWRALPVRRHPLLFTALSNQFWNSAT